MARFRPRSAALAISIIALLLTTTPVAASIDEDTSFEFDKILAPSSGTGSFGASMDVDGNTLVATSPDGGTSAHVYDLSTRPARLVGILNAPDAVTLRWAAIDSGTIAASGGGAIYVFELRRGQWRYRAKLTSEDGSDLQRLDIDGNTLVAAGGGSVHVFVRQGTRWRSTAIFEASDGSSLSNTAIDGTTIVALGGGNLHIFESTRAGWRALPVVGTSDAVELSAFNNSLDVDGDTIVAGAPVDSPRDVEAAGSAYVFAFDGAQWMEQAKLVASDPAVWVNFGRSAAVSGDLLVVGAAGFFADADDAAYIFTRSGGVWTQHTKLIRSDAPGDFCCELDYFGWSVRIADSAIAVAAMWDDEVGIDAGAIYLFRRPSP